MKVLFVELEPIGGPPHRLGEFVEYLSTQSNSNWEIIVVVDEKSVLNQFKFLPSIQIFRSTWPVYYEGMARHAKILRYLRTFIWLFSIMLRTNPDVVYCNHYQWVGYCAPLATLFSKSLIVHLRDIWPLNSDFTCRMLTSWKKTKYISISKYVKRVFESRYHIPAEKIHTIYDGIPSHFFVPKPKKIPDKKIVVSISRLEPSRNLEAFIETACFICHERNDVFFHHYGLVDSEDNKKYFAKLNRIVRAAGFEKNIKFFPYASRNKLRQIFNASYLNLITAATFALPNTAIESLLSGIPTIACDGSGNVEVIKSGVNGLLVKEANAYFFTEAIRFYLNNPNQYIANAARARKSVEKKFSSLKMDQHIESELLSLKSYRQP